MKKLVILLLLLGVSRRCYGFQHPAPPPDLSTPQAAVRAFVAAVAASDVEAICACVQGGRASPELKDALQRDHGYAAKLTGAEVKDIMAQVEGDKAKVAVEVTLQRPMLLLSNVKLPGVELFQMERRNGQWRIVPEEEAIKSAITFADPMTILALILPSRLPVAYMFRPLDDIAALAAIPVAAPRDPNTMLDSDTMLYKLAAKGCTLNQKEFAKNILVYAQDHDKKFPLKKALYKDLITPYVRNITFTCPMDAKGTISYTFNPNLEGVSTAYVKAPAQTVLLYEGRNMKFAFKHNGTTAVAFADGHVKLLTPEGAKQVFWYPAGKTPGVVKRP